MKDEFVKNIGIWGQRHYAYLKKHNPTVINVMRMKGTLEQYLSALTLLQIRTVVCSQNTYKSDYQPGQILNHQSKCNGG